MNDRSFLRLGAGAAIAGGLLALAGNVLHPRFAKMDDVDRFRRIADSNLVVAANLLLIAALVLVIAGFIAIATSLEGGRGGGLARFGRTAAVVGGTIAIAELGTELFALVQQAKIFASVPEQAQLGAFWATSAVDHLNNALFATWVVVLLGVAPVLVSMAMMASRRFPAWLGVAGLVGGLLCLGVGVFDLLRADTDPAIIPFFVGSLLDTAWLLLTGLLLWGQSAPEKVASASPAGAAPSPA